MFGPVQAGKNGREGYFCSVLYRIENRWGALLKSNGYLYVRTAVMSNFLDYFGKLVVWAKAIPQI